jgi:predicted O-methyltransferase YrrM
MRKIEQILAEDWDNYKTDLHPKDRRMSVLDEKGVKGMSTENVRYLFNELCKNYAPNGVYVEVGIYQGCSILSAALYNTELDCTGVDNFSQFDPNGDNLNTLRENIKKFESKKERGTIGVFEIDFRKFLRSFKDDGKIIDIYFYDGPHEYQDQMDGLNLALPLLNDKCIIIIDDVNLERTQRANNEFLANNPDFKSVMKILTVKAEFPIWHNGIEVMMRGFE